MNEEREYRDLEKSVRAYCVEPITHSVFAKLLDKKAKFSTVRVSEPADPIPQAI